MAARSDAGGTTSYSYGPLGRLASSTDADGRTTAYGYDLAGNRTSLVDAAGRTSSYGYDAAGELTSVAYSDGTTHAVTFSYDRDGRRTRMTDGTGTSTWAYDQAGRVIKTTDGAGDSVSYGYDPAGHQTSITYPGGHKVTRSFDAAGRPTSMTDWLGNTTTFASDPDGQLTATGYPAGTGETDTTSYDAAGSPTATTFGRAGTGGLASLSYTSDGAGRLTGIDPAGINGDSAHTYGFDANGWLTGDNTSGYSYDQTGRLTQLGDQTQNYDPAGQLCWSAPQPASGTCATPPAGAATYSFNPVGERTAATVPSGATTAYSWDQAGNLTGVTSTPTSGDGGGLVTAGSPQLVLDTRAASLYGTCNPAPCATLSPGGPVGVQVTGVGAIPAAGVQAVVADVTVINAQNAGTVSVWAAGAPQPSGASLHFDAAGLLATRQVLVPVGAGGRINIAATTTVDVTVTVTGWTTTSSSGGVGYVPAGGPQRVVSTVAGSIAGTCAPSPCRSLQANQPVTVTVAGVGSVPASGVAAVAVQVSVTNSRLTGGLTVWPDGATGPSATSLNFTRGQTTGGLLVVPVGADGEVDFEASGVGGFGSTLDVTADVIGWFTSGGRPVTAVGAARVADTAAGHGSCVPGPCSTVPAGGALTVKATGTAPIPATGIGAVWAQVTATPTSATATGVVSISDGTGAVTVANISGGQTVTGAAIVPIGPDGTITVSSTVEVDLAVDVTATIPTAASDVSYASDGTGLRITTTAAAGGTAAGGTADLVWDRSGATPLLLGDGTWWFVYGPDGPVEQINTRTHEPTWLHTDATGSVRMLTNTAGEAVGTATWGPWGQPVSITGNTSPLGYRGTYRDTTGLAYLWHRTYDPATGQYLSVDPDVATTDAPYTYADDDPVNNVDPTGLFCWGVCSISNAWNDTGGKAVHAVKTAGVDAGRFVYNNSSTLSTIASGLATVAYAGCAVTEGIGCGVGLALSATSTALSGINTYRACFDGAGGCESAATSFGLGVVATGAGFGLQNLGAGALGNVFNNYARDIYLARQAGVIGAGLNGLSTIYSGLSGYIFGSSGNPSGCGQ